MGILDQTKNEAPADGGKQVKFVRPGDSILAQFKSRKQGVKTKLSEDASVTQCLIVDSTIHGIGPGDVASIFEGSHVKQIMDSEGLSFGDGFILRYAENVGRFKKFFFKRVGVQELADEAQEKKVLLETVPF